LIIRAVDGGLIDTRKYSPFSSGAASLSFKSILLKKNAVVDASVIYTTFMNTEALPQGHRIIKYRLSSTFSPTPDWNYQSANLGITDAVLGMIFGENEDVIYHFGMQANNALITRI
jgi:hypothetical protein